MENIIESICIGCSCCAEEAQGYLDDELRNLRDLQGLDDLRNGDLECACSNLGIDNDYVFYFIEQLAC